MNKKISVMLVILVASMSVAPALAKSFKVPEGVTISYCSSGIAVIEDTPVGTLKITAVDVVDSTDGSGDFVHIDLWMEGWGGFVPLAVVGTNPDRMALFETIWSGVPAMGNNFVVSEDELKVDRHGNRITVSLDTDISCFVMYPTPHTLDIPVFMMELDKIGGSFHEQVSETLSYPGASGYTLAWDRMGFNAEGMFDCEEWDFAEPMTDCYVVMHSITTYTPPPPTPP